MDWKSSLKTDPTTITIYATKHFLRVITLKITIEGICKNSHPAFCHVSMTSTLTRVSTCNCKSLFPTHTTQCTQPEFKPGKLELGSLTVNDH